MAAASQGVVLFTGTSPTAAAGCLVSAPQIGFSGDKAVTFIADVIGATGGTLDVGVQHSPDGVTWYDYVHFSQLAAAAAAIVYHYSPALNDSITTIGKYVLAPASNTTITLANGSVAGGHWFDQLRCIFVPGAGTTVGAACVVTAWCVRD
jgi:hypothetical protein